MLRRSAVGPPRRFPLRAGPPPATPEVAARQGSSLATNTRASASECRYGATTSVGGGTSGATGMSTGTGSSAGTVPASCGA
jgi:hypothetical protein